MMGTELGIWELKMNRPLFSGVSSFGGRARSWWCSAKSTKIKLFMRFHKDTVNELCLGLVGKGREQGKLHTSRDFISGF